MDLEIFFLKSGKPKIKKVNENYFTSPTKSTLMVIPCRKIRNPETHEDFTKDKRNYLKLHMWAFKRSLNLCWL